MSATRLLQKNVNRLKTRIANMISPYQTRYIPTRNIHENIIVAQEFLNTMKTTRGKDFFAVKVNLAKEYDRIRWSFIANVLEEVGLSSHLRNIIMHCVTSVRINVLWHGCEGVALKFLLLNVA